MKSVTDTIIRLRDNVLSGQPITREEAMRLTSVGDPESFELFAAANMIRAHFRGEAVDLCSIINAKSGGCPEDCTYCAQSSRSKADIATYPLIGKDKVIEKAEIAKKGGARRFCIVTSGRKVSATELDVICDMISSVKSSGLLPCATLGLLSYDELELLKNSGLNRFHNNLETSEAYFPEICSTHTYKDKIMTILAAKKAGLSVCSGGIFGLGEDWIDRIDMAFTLREISPDSVPINFLTSIKGIGLEGARPLRPLEALRIISIYRFILPDKEIRVCGGRIQILRDLHSLVFFAGADGILTGNYLTTIGRSYEDDLDMVGDYGLRPA